MTPRAPGSFSHTETPRNGVEEVGFHPLLNAGFNTDIWGHVTEDGRLFGYSGTWGTLEGFADPGEACPSFGDNPSNPSRSGVKIVDLTNPAEPELAAKLGTQQGAQNNDVKVARMRIPGGFSGDLLAHSLEPCGAEGLAAQVLGPPATDVPREQTGFQLYDVSDPASPEMLGNYNNGGIGTHNLYVVPRPDLNRAFVAAVYNEVGVATGVRGTLQLVEVTDPESPELASEWELSDEEIECEERGTDSANCVLHDVWASADGKTLYLSYWDAGLVLLDISDPENPKFIGRGQQQLQDGDPEGWLNEEGNTHVAVPYNLGGRELVIVGDEDFTGGVAQGSNGYMVRANAPADVAREIPGVLWTNNADPDATGVTEDLVYAGSGCSLASYAPVAAQINGKIALVDDRVSATNPADQCPSYTFFQKVDAAEKAGAIGLVQVAREGDEPFEGNALESNIPAIEVANGDGVPLRDRVLAGEAVNVTIRKGFIAGLPVDPWGFMRVVDVTSSSDANWREVSTFKAPHVEDLDPAPEDVFTAHNPIPGPDGRIYYAWYTDGVRVLEPAGTTGSFNEVAWFVPRPSDRPDDHDSDPHGAQEDNLGFWGSFPICDPRSDDLLILNTDLNRGMYVLRLTGDSCRLRRSDVPAPVPSVTAQGLPRVNVVSPRLASNISRDHRFPVKITTAAPNVSHFQIEAFNTRERKWRRLSSRFVENAFRFAGFFGANYRFRARAVDTSGRTGPWDRDRTIVPFDDLRRPQRPDYRGRWKRPRNKRAYVGRLSRTSKRGSSMRFRFRGRRVFLIGRESRRGGKARVVLNGKKRRRVNFYRRRARNREVIVALKAKRRRVNTLRVVALGKKTKRSRGKRVEIDAIGVKRP